MKYALAVAEAKSFSQGAKNLFTSQPNISSAVNSLEEELGYKIFERTNQGVTMTHKGEAFLVHAKKIVSELDKVNKISEADPYRKLSIGSMFNYNIVSQAFSKFCTIYEDKSKFSFSLYAASSIDIIEDIYANGTDLGIILIDKSVLDGYRNSMRNKNLHFEMIRKMGLNVNLRKGHPLLEDESFDFSKLSLYPFVRYDFNVKSDFYVDVEFQKVYSMGFINLDKTITVDNLKTCYQLISSTDAYSIRSSFHPILESTDKIVSIPIPNIEMGLAFILREDQIYTKELKTFVELFIEEISTMTDIKKINDH